MAFTASAQRTPRNLPLTVTWQAADAGVQDGPFSCLLTRRFGDDPAEGTVQAACAGSANEVPPAPVTATTVHSDFEVLRQPADAGDPDLTETGSIALDAALYATRAGGIDNGVARGVSALRDGAW